MLVPLGWVVAILSAAAIHELSHALALVLAKIKIHKVIIKASGTIICTRCLTAFEQMICAAAGPAGGLLAAAALHRFPRFALCAFIQSIYNLLPVLPFDGGRILAAICVFLPDRAGRWALRISWFITVLLLVAVIFWLTIHI